MENCIDAFLKCNDDFCIYSATIANQNHLLTSTKDVNLQNQENCVCISNKTGENIDSTVLKQRSDAWFKLREKFKITGSTINKAIGLEGLHKQKAFLNESTGSKQPDQISDELRQMFEYGTTNEINAVATFVSTFLPAFYPELSFYEEGCYVEKDEDKEVIIVSPDGSIRNKNLESSVYFGVEIKCPFPGKLFSTPVHYKLPTYYVPQVLAEMKCLDVNQLFFLSYSQDSMTVHKANFNQELWDSINLEIQDVEASVPKTLRKTVPSIKDQISKYCSKEVTLVAEVTSRVAIPCDHSSDESVQSRIYHKRDVHFDKDVPVITLKSIQRTFLRCVDLIEDCQKICVHRATEVLVFLLGDLDRSYKPELPHAYPIAYGLKGYSMKTEAMRNMIQDVLGTLFVKGLYTPVVSYDGQWAKIAFQSGTEEPLTILELQKKVYNEVKSRSASDILRTIFERYAIKADSFDDLLSQINYVHMIYESNVSDNLRIRSVTTVSIKGDTKPFRTSSHTATLLQSVKLKGASNSKSNTKEKNDTETGSSEGDIDQILSSIPSDILTTLDEEVVESLNEVHLDATLLTAGGTSSNIDIGLLEVNNIQGDQGVSNDIESEISTRTETIEDTPIEEEPDATIDIDLNKQDKNVISTNDALVMFARLQSSKKWASKTFLEFQEQMKLKQNITSSLTKAELITCLDSFNENHADPKLHFCKSWNKEKLVQVLHEAFTKSSLAIEPRKRKRKHNPTSLINTCKKVIRSFPKNILNAIISEHEFPDRVIEWRQTSPFAATCTFGCINEFVWFSKPEYNQTTLSYIFSYLDMHHLITNCRVKVCKDGFPERGIHKTAWIDVARENKTNLKISHVEDLVDKQSDSMARETFSVDVEKAMTRLGYNKESQFCKIIREFYDGEDEPGISALERCQRRLNLRKWLLEGTNFCCFPPYGSHILGTPNIMFQGLMTNIDRRFQLFPYVKSGVYNVRSLGSLEAENFFGEFQDLDPKGAGVIIAEEVPMALESASQMLRTRLLPDRPFQMSLSRAKVYPVNELMDTCAIDSEDQYLFPQYVTNIVVRDHMFDLKERSKRKARRKLATIANPDDAARGVAPVRQYHKLDESKIFTHKRFGLQISD